MPQLDLSFFSQLVIGIRPARQSLTTDMQLSLSHLMVSLGYLLGS